VRINKLGKEGNTCRYAFWVHSAGKNTLDMRASEYTVEHCIDSLSIALRKYRRVKLRVSSLLTELHVYCLRRLCFVFWAEVEGSKSESGARRLPFWYSMCTVMRIRPTSIIRNSHGVCECSKRSHNLSSNLMYSCPSLCLKMRSFSAM